MKTIEYSFQDQFFSDEDYDKLYDYINFIGNKFGYKSSLIMPLYQKLDEVHLANHQTKKDIRCFFADCIGDYWKFNFYKNGALFAYILAYPYKYIQANGAIFALHTNIMYYDNKNMYDFGVSDGPLPLDNIIGQCNKIEAEKTTKEQFLSLADYAINVIINHRMEKQ